MKRDSRIDALKGFTMLLVILGHSIQANVSSFDSNIFFRVIYSFHMPLFMFLSGYVAALQSIHLSKKFKTLVIPFVAWYLIDYGLTGAFRTVGITEYLIRWIKSPDWGLWFLWVLFVNFSVLYVIRKATNNTTAISEAAILLLTIFLLQGINVKVLGLGLVKWHFIFFSGGYLASKHKTVLSKFARPIKLISLAFPFLAVMWYRTQPPSFVPALRHFFVAYHLVGFSTVLKLYRYGVPFLGIGFLFTLMPKSGQNKLYSALCWLGMFTLDIYVSHQIFVLNWHLGLGEGVIRIVTSSIIGLGLSLIVSHFFRKSKVLSSIFLGSWPKKPADRVFFGKAA